MSRSKAAPFVLFMLTTFVCVGLTGAILFGLPRDQWWAYRAAGALQTPSTMGSAFAGVSCALAGAAHALFRSDRSGACVRAAAELGALLAASALLVQVHALRLEWGLSWFIQFHSDHRMMFFLGVAILYGGVALLTRWSRLRSWAALLAVVGTPLPFLLDAYLTAWICRLFDKPPPFGPSYFPAVLLAGFSGVTLVGLAIYRRTRFEREASP